MTPERAMVLANQAMREAESIGPRKAIMQAILSAVAEERERCANIAMRYVKVDGWVIANAIRAGGE